MVRSRRSDGYDFVKVYNNVPRSVLTAMVDEARDVGMLVFGHVPRAERREGALEHALESGIDVIAHGEEFFFTRFYRGVEAGLDAGRVPTVDTAGLGEVVVATRNAQVSVIPNLSFVRQTRAWLEDPEALFSHREFEYLPPSRKDSWRQNHPGTRPNIDRFARRERAKADFLDLLVPQLHVAGVPLLAGTDASFAGLFPGASLQVELQELVRVGLSPFEALRTATLHPGRLISEMDERRAIRGVVQVGARADLILVDGDPTLDVSALRSIEGLVVAGRWIDVGELEASRPRWSGP